MLGLGRKTVWVIDDNPDILTAVAQILVADYRVETYPNGDKIQQLLEGNGRQPNIILLDYLLSGEDGIQLCQQLKAEDSTKNITVVMFSAYPQMAERAGLAGADGFLLKPFSVANLLATIKNSVKKK